MTTVIPTLPPNPDALTQSTEEFDQTAYDWSVALGPWTTAVNQVATEVAANALSAAAAAAVKNVGTYKGVYNAGTTYALGESVSYGDAFWLSNQNGNLAHTPVEGAWWSVVDDSRNYSMLFSMLFA